MSEEWIRERKERERTNLNCHIDIHIFIIPLSLPPSLSLPLPFSYNDGTKESYFSVGLQGIASDDTEKVKQIISDTFIKVYE